MERLKCPLEFAREKIVRVVNPGDSVLDATCGNGKDTLFLADCVGPGGRVYAFDIQDKALKNTAKLLGEHGLSGRVSLFQRGHEDLLNCVHEPLKAAVFNLGYLPGADHGLITRVETTIEALKAVFSLLIPGGMVSVVAYTGHAGGDEEARGVERYLRSISQREFAVLQYQFINQANHPPRLFLIEKV